MKIAIILNGTLSDQDWHSQELKNYDHIIAADGGADNCMKLGITPHAIIGDMDSIKTETLEYFKTKSKIIVDENQDYTDLEAAIMYAKTLGKHISVFCWAGNRHDHTMANLLSLETGIKACDRHSTVHMVDSSLILDGKKGELVTVIALSDVEGLQFEGLKWPVNNIDVLATWRGVSNEMLSSKASISLKKGRVLVFRCWNSVQ